MSATRPRIFSIEAGAPFLRTLARSILDGQLVDGLAFDPANPLALGAATIYVPTRRAARVLRSEFVELIGVGSAILPSIRPLGETDEDGHFLDDEEGADSLELLPPVTGLERTMELARLILAWRNALPDHIVELHSGSPIVAPASPADAVWLAKSLASLIDSIETEECDWEQLAALDAGDHALWWQLTAKFLAIASVYWPGRLTELNRSSPARHRAHRLDGLSARYKAGKASGPVIIAGSTGSVPATARLIEAVSRMDKGAVVLPGLDFSLSDEEFRIAGGLASDGVLDPGPASRSHPQYGLFQLLSRLKASRADVVRLGDVPNAIATRHAVLSASMLPSQSTSAWPERRQDFDAARLQNAFAGVSLVEAANEREEATAIAIALKLAVSGSPHAQAALVTPDRTLARRVGLELARFGIAADDSAGTPLLSSPVGSLVHLALEACLAPGDPVTLAGLLKHPLVRLGKTEADHLAAVSALELIVLRDGSGSLSVADIEDHLDAALTRQSAPDARTPIWRAALAPDAPDMARELCRALRQAADPLLSLAALDPTPTSFSTWAEATGRVIEQLCADDKASLATLWTSQAGDCLASLLRGLMEDRSGMEADAGQWIEVMTALMAGEGVRPASTSHPRIFIWGTLEARLQHVDTLVLGGLNEGTWPSKTANDPFLSRTMKTAIGLEPPERRIGQSAHDFMMAACETNLVLTRSLRDGSAPTVASRFIQRMLALAGSEVVATLKARGQAVLDQVVALDEGPSTDGPGRPAPKPPEDRQPKRFSFSEVAKLRRDPYAIYAKRVLKLEPLTPFIADPGFAERGTLYHAVAEAILKAGVIAGTPEAERVSREIIDRAFADAALPIHVEAVWRPGLTDVVRSLLAFEAERAGSVKRTVVEASAYLDIVPDRLAISGRADRIDLLPDGRADIIDYKTGSNPSVKVARSLLDPQLPLEAAVLAGGGFKGLGAHEARNLTYIRLKAGHRFKVDKVNEVEEARSAGDKPGAMDLADKAVRELTRLVEGLASGKLAFVSRLVPAKANDYGGEYDHLARVAEWTTAEEGEAGDDAE